jgi:hypothetical protein
VLLFGFVELFILGSAMTGWKPYQITITVVESPIFGPKRIDLL